MFIYVYIYKHTYTLLCAAPEASAEEAAKSARTQPSELKQRGEKERKKKKGGKTASGA